MALAVLGWTRWSRSDFPTSVTPWFHKDTNILLKHQHPWIFWALMLSLCQNKMLTMKETVAISPAFHHIMSQAFLKVLFPWKIIPLKTKQGFNHWFPLPLTGWSPGTLILCPSDWVTSTEKLQNILNQVTPWHSLQLSASPGRQLSFQSPGMLESSTGSEIWVLPKFHC